MSISTAERMRKLLNDTGVYRLTGTSSADWEINAAAAGLESLESAIDRLTGDIFAETASSAAIDKWESLFRPQPSHANITERRQMLRARLSLNPTCFTPKSLPDILAAAGVAGEALEEEDGLRVLFGSCMGITEEEAERELNDLLPAHILWRLDKAFNWVMLNAFSAQFKILDARGLTWSEIEALTTEDLQKYNKEGT